MSLGYYEKTIKNLKKRGSDLRGRCPIHRGSNDSAFAVNPDTLQWYCHVCVKGGDAISLEREISGCTFLEAQARTGKMVAMKSDSTRHADITYDYCDENGELLYQVVRKYPKKFLQRRPENGEWSYKLAGVRRVLYRLPELVADTDSVVWFVEGEKDADRLVREGLLATTNSGGAKKINKEILMSLSGRTIALCCDQDEVGQESAALAQKLLVSLGCIVNRVDLEGVKDVSEWLDKGHTVNELLDVYNSITPQSAAIAPSDGGWPVNLDDMLATYVVVRGTDHIFCKRTARTVKPTALRLAHGQNLFKGWSESKRLETIDLDRIVFAPGGCRVDELNLFTGLPEFSDDAPGPDIVTWLSHVQSMVGSGANYEWFLARLAFKLQHLDVKVGSSIVLHGKPGSGKNLTFAPLMAIYGKYSREVGQNQVDSPYTGWLSGALLILADEVNIQSNRTLNRFKSLITSGDIAIEEKYQPVRFERNYADIHFLSNETMPLSLEADDRRYFVAHTSFLADRDYYRRLASVTPSSVRKYLHEYNTERFDPKGAPPMTDAKRDLIATTRCSCEAFVFEWLGNNLPVSASVATSTDLYRAYALWARVTGERTVQPERVFRTKATQLLGQTKIKKLDGSSARCYVPESTENSTNPEQFRHELVRWITEEQKAKL